MAVRNWVLGGVLLLLWSQLAGAHVGRHIAVIVDTDTALDDIRALTLLIQSEDVDLLAVVTSDGACSPETGARNVRLLLRALGEDGTPVAAGPELGLSPPPWRTMSETLGWSTLRITDEDRRRDGAGQEDGSSEGSAETLIKRALKECEAEVIYLCLGPLTNLAAALEADSSLVLRLASVYYAGTGPGAEPPSWNTARDFSAAQAVFEYQLPIFSFQVADEDLLTFDAGFLGDVCGFSTPAAQLVCRLHENEKVQQLIESKHFRCWDEMAVLGLLYPELCPGQTESDQSLRMTVTHFDHYASYVVYLNLLSGDMSMKSGHRSPVVLIQYPTDPALLRADIRPLAPAIIERHGLEEWNAALLANEFHRHLGIYSLLGVKMGIRAREILEAGVDELQVISLAGSRPPLSCLTDGLQVATGASLGRGTISVDPDTSEPAAVFIKGVKQLTLRLKPEIAAQIQTDIRTTISRHGLLTQTYWRAIREIALRYWLDMHRSEIFDESPEEAH